MIVVITDNFDTYIVNNSCQYCLFWEICDSFKGKVINGILWDFLFIKEDRARERTGEGKIGRREKRKVEKKERGE